MRKKYADSNEITIKTITFKIRPPKCFKHTEKKTDPYLHSYCMVLVQMSTPVNLVLCIGSECLQVSGQIGKGQHRPKSW